jgi:hypothetical protein
VACSLWMRSSGRFHRGNIAFHGPV